MAWFPCNIGGGGGSGKAYKNYLGQLIPRVSSSSANITDSGCDASFYSWYAFNGISPSNLRNPDNCWSATQNETNAWIQYEFDRIYYFDKIAIKCFSNYGGDWVGDIKVLGSLNGTDWDNLLIGSTNVEITATLQQFATIEINLNNNKMYQYIRVQADNNAFTVYYNPSCFFDEIYVYGGIITGDGNATVVEGTFTSASTQHGIVDVNIGFKPDLVMVFMKLGDTGQDTCSFWEKDASWAETKAIWCLVPAESSSYEVTLGRLSGETGIQQINNDGFSYMSNGANTRGCTCRYVAVKYEQV